MENKWTVILLLWSSTVQQVQGISGTARPWSAYPTKTNTPAVIDGEVIGRRQAIVLDPGAQYLVSRTVRNTTNFNNEESVKQRHT